MKRYRQSRSNEDQPIKRKQCNDYHECEVTLERLFLEKAKWQYVTNSLQNQIDVLTAVGGAPPQAAIVEESDESKKPPSMPSSHPLFAFLQENFSQSPWSRTPCGAARRCYCLAHEQGASGSPKLNHIEFAREMSHYFPRQGCRAKAHYVGLTLIDKALNVTGTQSTP
jgi:hypothetical protein